MALSFAAMLLAGCGRTDSIAPTSGPPTQSSASSVRNSPARAKLVFQWDHKYPVKLTFGGEPKYARVLYSSFMTFLGIVDLQCPLGDSISYVGVKTGHQGSIDWAEYELSTPASGPYRCFLYAGAIWSGRTHEVRLIVDVQ